MGKDSMEGIRRFYGVPAKRGGRIKHTWRGERLGTIVGAERGNMYLRIRLDGDKHIDSYHPTWEIEYLAEGAR